MQVRRRLVDNPRSATCIVALLLLMALYSQGEEHSSQRGAGGSCFALLETPGPPFAAGEIASLSANFLANVNVGGTGAVVAAPDRNTSRNQNYFWHWPRDAALVMISLQTNGMASDSMVAAYAEWEAGRLELAAVNGNPIVLQSGPAAGAAIVDPMVEPKFAIPSGEIFRGIWCRPQNDAPGLRAIALMLYAERQRSRSGATAVFASRLDRAKLWRADGSGTIQRSLAYLTAGGWREMTCDLWEEVTSTDFFWNRVTMKRALEMGASFASAMGDARTAQSCRSTAQTIGTALRTHTSPDGGFLTEEPLPPHPPIAQRAPFHRWVDSAVILALNFGFDDPRPPYAPTSSHVAATVAAHLRAFCAEHPVNSPPGGGGRHASSRGLGASGAAPPPLSGAFALEASSVPVGGVLIGRYPGDVYHGGNPWVLTTAALAQLLFRVGAAVVGVRSPVEVGAAVVGVSVPVEASATLAEASLPPTEAPPVPADASALPGMEAGMEAGMAATMQPDVVRTWARALNAPALVGASPVRAAALFARAGDSVLSRLAQHARLPADTADTADTPAGVGARAARDEGSTSGASGTVLHEQLDERTGRQTGARSLTWSYAEVFNALHWREELHAALRRRRNADDAASAR